MMKRPSWTEMQDFIRRQAKRKREHESVVLDLMWGAVHAYFYPPAPVEVSDADMRLIHFSRIEQAEKCPAHLSNVASLRNKGAAAKVRPPHSTTVVDEVKNRGG